MASVLVNEPRNGTQEAEIPSSEAPSICSKNRHRRDNIRQRNLKPDESVTGSVSINLNY